MSKLSVVRNAEPAPRTISPEKHSPRQRAEFWRAVMKHQNVIENHVRAEKRKPIYGIAHSDFGQEAYLCAFKCAAKEGGVDETKLKNYLSSALRNRRIRLYYHGVPFWCYAYGGAFFLSPQALNWRQKAVGRHFSSELAEADEKQQPTQEKETFLSELRTRIASALSHLSERNREIIRLHGMEGFTLEETAAALGVGSSIVRRGWDASEKRLRTLLAAEGLQE